MQFFASAINTLQTLVIADYISTDRSAMMRELKKMRRI